MSRFRVGLMDSILARAQPSTPTAWFPGLAHRPQDYSQRLETIRSAAQVPLSVVKGMVLNVTVDDVLEQAAEWLWRYHGAGHRFCGRLPAVDSALQR